MDIEAIIYKVDKNKLFLLSSIKSNENCEKVVNPPKKPDSKNMLSKFDLSLKNIKKNPNKKDPVVFTKKVEN